MFISKPRTRARQSSAISVPHGGSGDKKMHSGPKNESGRGATHPGRNSWEAAQVYPRANTADQKSGGTRQEQSGNWRVGRRDRWFAASHLLQVGHQPASTPFQDRNRPAAAK